MLPKVSEEMLPKVSEESEEDPDRTSTTVMPQAVRVGSRFADRYQVEALLGVGATGSVYRVHDDVLDEIVALKLLGDAANDTTAHERHRREVRLARRVTHRNVARTYDLGDWQGQPYLTMEYVAGASLREHMRKRLELKEILDITGQIAEGLAAAHRAGVIHRDLKPANVMIEVQGRVVITDFGIAGTRDAGSEQSMIGTPAYMAPEQVVGEATGPGTDLYALGVMLYEMLTGELPFSGDSPVALAVARLSQAPRLQDKPAIPTVVIPLLRALLEHDVERRLSDASEVASRARAIVRDLTIPAPSSVTTASGSLAAVSDRAIAVLPFRHHGPADQRYLSETLGDELIDVLQTMKGLRVSASGATARFANVSERDPRAIGHELGVELIVDASVTVSGSRIRIAARLIEVISGSQIWSERYEGTLADVFELQDKMGRRIGEALRLELEQLFHRAHVPDAAIDAYLRARALGRSDTWAGPEGAVAQFQRCLQIAPTFRPGLAGYAVACLRAWFAAADGRDYAELAHAAVEAARSGAPELAETHLAIAMRAVQLGNYHEAAIALHEALRIAPTYAAAHDYLGRLQLEAGRPEQGVRHVELALELDPSLVLCLRDLARYHALRGDREQCELWWQRRVEANPVSELVLQEIRHAAWFGDHEWLQRLAARSRDLSHPIAKIMMSCWIDTTLDEAAVRERYEQLCGSVSNQRLRTLLRQGGCEIAAWRGFDELALHHLSHAAAEVLVDLDWMDRCPLLERLRGTAAFAEARKWVAARAAAIWTA
jgi:serine/threonine protein kinase/tetratricopeptide (TPR) repeat protein